MIMLTLIVMVIMMVMKIILTLLQIQGECPSDACAGSCQECGESSPDDVDCWGVRWTLPLYVLAPKEIFFVKPEKHLNTHLIQGVGLLDDIAGSPDSGRGGEQGWVPTALHWGGGGLVVVLLLAWYVWWFTLRVRWVHCEFYPQYGEKEAACFYSWPPIYKEGRRQHLWRHKSVLAQIAFID